MSGRPLQKYGKEPEGFWRDIPDLEGYQASVNGEIRRLYKKGYRILTPFKKWSCRMYVVKIHRKEMNPSRLVYMAFYGDIPDGMVIMHNDGVMSNNAVYNLKMVTREEFGKKTGCHARQKAVLKYDPVTMECVGAYRSARECARRNFYTYQAIIERCNGKAKKAPAQDGFEYCWEDDGYNTSYNRMVKRIEEARERGVI